MCAYSKIFNSYGCFCTLIFLAIHGDNVIGYPNVIIRCIPGDERRFFGGGCFIDFDIFYLFGRCHILNSNGTFDFLGLIAGGIDHQCCKIKFAAHFSVDIIKTFFRTGIKLFSIQIELVNSYFIVIAVAADGKIDRLGIGLFKNKFTGFWRCYIFYRESVQAAPFAESIGKTGSDPDFLIIAHGSVFQGVFVGFGLVNFTIDFKFVRYRLVNCRPADVDSVFVY